MLASITADMKQAMKDGDKLRLSAIRMLRAALKEREIELGRAPDEQEIGQVVARLIKQRRDAVKQYQQASRNDLAEREQAEIDVLMHYMPAQMDDAAIDAAVREAIRQCAAKSMRDMGQVMGCLRHLRGQADMARVSARVRECLQEREGQALA